MELFLISGLLYSPKTAGNEQQLAGRPGLRGPGKVGREPAEQRERVGHTSALLRHGSRLIDLSKQGGDPVRKLSESTNTTSEVVTS